MALAVAGVVAGIAVLAAFEPVAAIVVAAAFLVLLTALALRRRA